MVGHCEVLITVGQTVLLSRYLDTRQIDRVLNTTNKKCENCFLFRDESAETDAAVMAVEAHPGKRLSQ